MALAGATRITCADVSKEWTDIGRRYWREAGVEDRIDLYLDGGKAVIERLLAQGEAGSFDLAFIDADKTGCDSYYEGSLQLLRPGGLILIDNVLWGGDVADPDDKSESTEAIRAINAKAVRDSRVEICMVPICDGVTMARKL
jgi:caffeoyl-CoA O-methyltransferase